MSYKRYLLALTLISHVMSTESQDALASAANTVKKAMISPLKTSFLYKGIDSSFFSANGYWKVYPDKTFKDGAGTYVPNPNSVAIYVGDSIRRAQNGSLLGIQDNYLVLSSNALQTLAQMHDNPESAEPFVIELNGYRYIFDIYLSWLGYNTIGKYFIMNRYKIAESTGKTQFTKLEGVLDATFIDASKAQDKYVDEEPENIIAIRKLKSPDGVAEINLNDTDIQQALLDVANNGTGAVVISTIVRERGVSRTEYFYKYRFVISWGEYKKFESNGGRSERKEINKRAFFVSTSFVYLPNGGTIGQNPPTTLQPANNNGIKISTEQITDTA